VKHALAHMITCPVCSSRTH